jgi:glycosyltransferase involved in cell wall biosynthesis
MGARKVASLMLRSQKNVLMFLDKAFPPDIRVEKESASLIKAGYNVFLLGRKKEGRADFEVYKGIRVLRVKWPIWPIRKMTLWYPVDLLKLFTKSMSIIIKYNIRILHVHDLPYALFVVMLGKILRRKVVFDMHEHFVAMSAPVLKKRRMGRSLRLLIFFLRFQEIISCKFSTKTIAVVEENAKRVVNLGIPSNKVVVVSNTADVDLLDNVAKDFTKEERFQGKFVVSYVGGFSLHRGLDTLISAIPLVAKKNPEIHLLLIGGGEMESTLHELVNTLDIKDHVTFTGWVPFDEAMKYIQLSDLGAIPYHSTPHTNCTVPHKVFQYMYFKKPVLISDVKPLKRIIEAAECGLVFRAGDPGQLAQEILAVMKNPHLLKELGENGHKAVVEKYNWNNEQTKLIRMYDEILKSE